MNSIQWFGLGVIALALVIGGYTIVGLDESQESTSGQSTLTPVPVPDSVESSPSGSNVTEPLVSGRYSSCGSLCVYRVSVLHNPDNVSVGVSSDYDDSIQVINSSEDYSVLASLDGTRVRIYIRESGEWELLRVDTPSRSEGMEVTFQTGGEDGEESP